MIDEAFKEFKRRFYLGPLCCVILTSEQADELKALIDIRIRDVAPKVTPRFSPRAGGCPGSGSERPSPRPLPRP